MKFPCRFLYLLFILHSIAGSLAQGQPTLALQSAAAASEWRALQSVRLARPSAAPADVKVRPFITDDARVVGARLAQLETWLRTDREAAQQWLLMAYGPTKNLELTVGGVVGLERRGEAGGRALSYALPLVQAKFLLREYKPNRAPGLGVVVGTFLPNGRGSFKPAGYGTFGFLTVTQSLGHADRVLLHGNVGGNYLHIDGTNQFIRTWGIGTQVRAYKGCHVVGEVFSGDPYIPGTGTAYQIGYRYFFSDRLQIDMTVGDGIGGVRPMPVWFTAGVRVVSERFRRSRS